MYIYIRYKQCNRLHGYILLWGLYCGYYKPRLQWLIMMSVVMLTMQSIQQTSCLTTPVFPGISSLPVSPSPSSPSEDTGSKGPNGGDSIAWIAAPVVITTVLLLLVCGVICVCLLRVARRVNRKRVRVQPHIQLDLGPIPGVPLAETLKVDGATATPSINSVQTNGSISDQLLDDLNTLSSLATSSKPSLNNPDLELKNDWTYDAIEDLSVNDYFTQGDHDVIVTRHNAYPTYAKISTPPPHSDRSRRGKVYNTNAVLTSGRLANQL